jgi:hypothetical protein
MTSRHIAAIRLSAPVIAVFVVVGISLILLVGKRLDMSWAGGKGAGPQHDAILAKSTATSLPQTLSRGETITTDAHTFAAYAINNQCTVYLAENSSLLLEDGRDRYNVFHLLTGRAVAEGDCTFITRETEASISGKATLIHYSWLDELVVNVFLGSAVVTQSDATTAMTPEIGALRFFTLPSKSRSVPATFSPQENEIIAAFYSWSSPP